MNLDIKRPWLANSLLYAFWFAMFCLWFFHAWVSEDAYVTFRVIDNFMHGHGLRWNITERVQPYTHPLWMLINIPLVYLWPNIFYANIALSLLLSTAAVGTVIYTFRHRPTLLLLGFFMLPLLLSKSFGDYTTSGLETSLSYFLFALIGFVLLHKRQHRYFWLFFTGLCSLLLLNRLDHLLLIAPVYVWLLLDNETKPKFGQIAIALLPLALWHLFSLFYYGFIFPNTKYAKLDTNFPLLVYLEQGAHYAFIWLTHDTSSVLVLIGTLVLAAYRWKILTIIQQCLIVGLVLNVAYVVYVGGDYMMGRFWAFPFFVSCWLLIAILPDQLRTDYFITAVSAILVAFSATLFVKEIREFCPTCIPVKGRVLDAQNIFWRNTLFAEFSPLEIRVEGNHKFGRRGKRAAKKGDPVFKRQRYAGMEPYYTGSSGIFIDELALADPLLSRLPAETDKSFYIGHFRRTFPKGYYEAVHEGRLHNMDEDLAEYYKKIRLITRGELWDSERLMTILRFNLGQYDYLRERYVARTQ